MTIQEFNKTKIGKKRPLTTDTWGNRIKKFI